MKFNVYNAEIIVCNPNDPCFEVTITLMEADNLFTMEQHKLVLNPPMEFLPKFQTMVAEQSFPQFNGKLEIVNDLPKFRVWYDEEGRYSKHVFDSLRILIQTDEDGNLYQDPKKAALDYIDRYCELVN
jgi:hypothetical protein